jgi:hypothetical protein
MRRGRSTIRAAFVALLLAAVAACDSGPSGPGALTVTVESDGLGGALLEVTGPGIIGFQGLGDTRVYDAELAGTPDAHRVLLVDPTGGQLRFEIEVEDIGMDDPVLTVVSAAGVDNQARLNAGIVTRIER